MKLISTSMQFFKIKNIVTNEISKLLQLLLAL